MTKPNDSYYEQEKLLIETLAQLRSEYENIAKPYVERLVRLHALQLPSITVTEEMVRNFGLEAKPK